jgi:chromosome segregation ATPase
VRSLWFGWWVAICLGVLAYHTNAQLEAQKRILTASQQLQAKVGEAAVVSAETNHQLGKVAELDAATTAMAGTLQHLSQTNAAVKGELAGMEATVDGLVASVQRLDGQAVASHETLLAVARESEALLALLRSSQATGATVSSRLQQMVNLQVSINADLDEMNRNTRDLDRFLGR